MQRNDPVPQGIAPAGGDDSPADPGDGHIAPPLRHVEIGFLRQALAREQHRRRLYRAGHVRVCIDGEEWRRCNLSAPLSELFNIPLTTSYVEIFGEDADGPLLLAVFPLSAQASFDDEAVQQLWITLEGGQTVGIAKFISLGGFGEASWYFIQLTYSEAPEVPRRSHAHLTDEPLPTIVGKPL